MNGMKILVVEDEFALATELANHFRSLGAEVLGPVPSLDKAAKYIEAADGAILDIDLNGEAVFPLADALVSRGVPFVFFSGQEQIRIPQRFRFSPSLVKPANLRRAAELLSTSTKWQLEETTDIFEVLPKLRLAARLYLGDSDAADRLVERTLKAALEDTSSTRNDLPLARWLDKLMDGVLAAQGAQIRN